MTNTITEDDSPEYRQQLFVLVIDHNAKHRWVANELINRVQGLPNVRQVSVFVSGNSGELLIESSLSPDLKEILNRRTFEE